MLVGIMGKMGSGKTLSMSILATLLHRLTGAPLYANYQLDGSNRVLSLKDLWRLDDAIFCFDELWLTMDARLWKDNTKLTRWVNQTRKKKMIVFYTTQHIRQVELRVRNATDILIYCEKQGSDHWLNFIDYQYKRIGRKFRLTNPVEFYKIYDTFEVLQPIKYE